MLFSAVFKSSWWWVLLRGYMIINGLHGIMAPGGGVVNLLMELIVGYKVMIYWDKELYSTMFCQIFCIRKWFLNSHDPKHSLIVQDSSIGAWWLLHCVWHALNSDILKDTWAPSTVLMWRCHPTLLKAQLVPWVENYRKNIFPSECNHCMSN